MEAANSRVFCLAAPFLTRSVQSAASKEFSSPVASTAGELDCLLKSRPDLESHTKGIEDPSFARVNSPQSADRAQSSLETSSPKFTIPSHGNETETESFSKQGDGFRKDCTFITIGSSHGVGEVTVSIRSAEEVECEKSNVQKFGTVDKDVEELGSREEDGCLSLVGQVRAFIKGVKLSCGALVSGESRTFHLEGLICLLQTYFCFESSEEVICFSGENCNLIRSVSSPNPITSNMSPSRVMDPLKIPEVRELRRQGSSLGRSADRQMWKEGQLKAGQVTFGVVGCKSPGRGNWNWKKPPKPPRHPGTRQALAVDTAALAALRAARKSRQRATAKRKSRAAARAGSSLPPLLALVLTIGFGGLMFFQGVFIQTNLSYGKNISKAFVDVAANLRSVVVVEKIVPNHEMDLRTPPLYASSNTNGSSQDAEAVDNAFQNSINDLPWSRSSLAAQAASLPR